MQEYTSTIKTDWIKLEICCNNLQAKNKKKYIQKLKDQFYKQYGFELSSNEITEIQLNKKKGV
jgi:hypothetical protein